MPPVASAVLLIEDDLQAQTIIRSCCERLGLTVTACTSSEQAHLHLQRHHYDIIIVDHHLHGDGTGLELLTSLQDATHNFSRILCSGNSDPQVLIEAINDGHIDAFLSKPIRPELCISLLNRSLEIASLRNHNRELLKQLAVRNSELEANTAALNTTVEDRTVHLEEMSRRLQEKHHELVRMETQGAIGHLARGLAHELNNPLAAILGYAQRLERSTDDTESKRKLNIIITEVDRCRGLVERLRRLAAPVEEEMVPCDPAETAIHASGRLREQLTPAPPLHIDPNLPAVQAGPRSLERIFEQILLNASQADATAVHLSAETSNERIHLHFDNNGATPTDNEIANAGRPFFTTKSTIGGRGLGLAIVSGLLREQDGALTLNRRPDGTGARITISLPLASGSGRYHRLRRVEQHPQVLVIDDEPLIAELLADCLTEIGCDVRTVATIKEAHELIAKQPLRAIIADVHLTDGSGIDFLRQATRAHSHLIGHVALITGDAQAVDLRTKADESGFPILSKPFRLEAMTEFVARLL